MDQSTIDWLRGLAEKGGKGVVNNIDARSLGRIADELERARDALKEITELYSGAHGYRAVEIARTALTP